MKKLLFIVLSLCSLTLAAQNAKEILDTTADKIRACGDVKVDFTATTFAGLEEKESTSGTMLLSGKKMQLSTPYMITWYDGVTQWNYIKNSNEVDICTPTKREMASLHPYAFLSIYKKGFRSSFKESTLRGQEVYEVHLQARFRSMEVQEIYVDVRKSDYTPLCIRVRQGENWSRIAMDDYKAHQNFTDEQFTFNQKDYPNALVVDLR